MTGKPALQNTFEGWRFKSLMIVMALSALGYLFFALWGGWDNVIAAVVKVGYFGVFVALLLSLFNYFLRFLRWHYYLKVLNYHIPFFKNLQIYISGFSFTATPAKTGEMVRSLFLKDFGVRYDMSLGVFLSERIADLISVLILATIGLWEYPKAQPVCLVVGIIMVLFLVALQKKSLIRGAARFSKRWLTKRQSRPVYFLAKILLASRSCFSLKALIVGIFLGVLAWGAEGVAFYYLLHLLGSDLNLQIAIFIYAFAILIGAITFLPGGLGGAEITMLQLLIFYQIPDADAVVATLFIRITTLWFSIGLGLMTLPFALGSFYSKKRP